MTGRRSKFVHSQRSFARLRLAARGAKRAACVALLVLVATACASRPPRHPLERPPPSRDLVGRLAFHEARAEDTFVDLAPALGVGYVELLNANLGVDPWLPPPGTRGGGIGGRQRR